MTDTAALQAYVERYFVSLDELAALGGTDTSALTDLIAARAIPGPIYSLWPNGAFWSMIGGSHGDTPRGEPTHWYAPAAAWWIRRARNLSPTAAATAFEARFVADFVARLAAEPQGSLGYPAVYASGQFVSDAAAIAGRSEWRDWINGGYGVCLRHADAHHAIVKTCRRASVLSMTDAGRATALAADAIDHLLTVLEELDAVMLPFAPHQRPHGTPGLWLDATLERYGLGRTSEAAQSTTPPIPQRLCA